MTQGRALCVVLLVLVLVAARRAAAGDTLLSYDEAVRKELAAAAEGRMRYEAPGQMAAHTAIVTVPEAFAAASSKPMTVPWTEVVLAGFEKHKTSPNRAARGLGLLHVAMHDAVVLSDQLCRQRPASSSAERWRRCASHHPESVVAAAAARLLRYLFVAEEGYFDRLAAELGRRAVQEGRTTEAAVAPASSSERASANAR